MSNANRQKAWRARQKQAGLTRMTVWADEQQAAAIKAILVGQRVLFRPGAPAVIGSSDPAPQPAEQAPEPVQAVSSHQPDAQPAGKPQLKRGDRPGVWRVLVEGVEVGTVTKVRHEGIGGAFDRWKPRKPSSIFSALSDITYRTREQAVRALVE